MALNIYSDPEWIRDQGNGSITIKNFDIKFKLIPTNENGFLQFKFKDTQLNVGDLDGTFKGKTEIIESVNLIMQHFKQFFKEELTEIVTMQFANNLQDKLNKNLREQTPLMKFDDNIFINTSLTSHPFVKNGYIVMPYDGTVYSDKKVNPTKSINDIKEMPIDFGNHNSLQLLISDHFMNSTFKSYYQAGQLYITHAVSPVFVKSLISNFEDVYGDNYDKVTIKLEAQN